MRRCIVYILLLAAAQAQAHTFCVGDPAGLQAALATAAGNGEADSIQLVRGFYSVADFSFNSAEALGLDITGGYDAGCNATDADARQTVLDGGGAYQVLQTYSPGAVSIRYLTVQSGVKSGSSGAGLQLGGTGPASAVTLGNLILRNNTSDYGAGGVVIGVEGDVSISNNLFVDNSAPGTAALYIFVGVPASIYITNNTFSANTATTPYNAAAYLNVNSSGVSAHVSNNIFWGNAAAMDFGFSGDNVQLIDNDCGVLSGSPAAGSTGNVSVDPHFVSAGDWHLRIDSPLLGTGATNPAGGLPAFDIEGHARSFNGAVDPGAYQRDDLIFADSFGG